MATMIPAEPPSELGGTDSETALFHALRDQLPDEYHVYCGLTYLTDKRPTPGEVDFLIVHRERGMLFVECKGNGVYLESGRWYRQFRGRRKPLRRPPADQAASQCQSVVGRLRDRMRGVVRFEGRFPFSYGHAVAFPFADVASVTDGTLEMPLDIVIDATDLASIQDRIDRLFGYYRADRQVTPLDEESFERFTTELLHPSLAIVPSLRGRFALERADFCRLDNRQRQVIESLIENERFAVVGPAGSGKTLLAVEAARRLARDEGLDVLLLCFNKMLRLRLEERIDGVATGAGSISVEHFHALSWKGITALGLDERFPPAGGPDVVRHFWEVTAPEKLFDALSTGHLERYDAIIVDEAQDIRGDWWPAVEMLLREPGAGRLVALYDPDQAIFSEGAGVPRELFRLRLVENYRNTIAITDALAELASEPIRPHPDAPEGVPPSFSGDLRPAKASRKVDELVGKLTRDDGLDPSDIVVLSPHTQKNGCLAGCATLGGHRITRDLFERGDAILFATIGRFKGLEAKVVILVDVDPRDPRCTRRERYVGASRARHELHVMGRGGHWLSAPGVDTTAE